MSLIKSATRNSLSNYNESGIRGPALKWVKEFLDNRHQYVIVNGSSTEPTPVHLEYLRGLCLDYFSF